MNIKGKHCKQSGQQLDNQAEVEQFLASSNQKGCSINDGNNPFTLYKFMSHMSDIYENDIHPFHVFLFPLVNII